MFELSKEILEKVSFDRDLFKKELEKAIKWLCKSEEVRSLRKWCLEKFKHYNEIIESTFAKSQDCLS
ncbi:MAG: hypothetical protein ACKOXB_11025 [Flavobacteriales bacterium]